MFRFSCYPPAEARIPPAAFMAAVLPDRSDFAKALCNYLGTDHCILANSGRALLYRLLAAAAVHQPKRREVLVPGYTCYSVAAAVVRAGLSIRPYELEPDTLLPDYAALQQAASERTLGIIVQHLFGIPVPMNEIRRIAESTGAVLIEDAAQALGGTFNNQFLGTQGDFGLFSFGRGKPLPLGGGGALIGKTKSVLDFPGPGHRNSGLLRFAVSAAAQVASKPYIYALAEMLPLGLGETVFEPDFAVSSMGTIMERLGSRSLAFLPDLNEHRSRIAGIYQSTLRSGSTIPLPAGAEPVYTRFPALAGPVSMTPEMQRLGIRRMYPKALADEEDIHPFLADDSAATPGAAQIALNLVTLPTHADITEPLAARIAYMINRCST